MHSDLSWIPAWLLAWAIGVSMCMGPILLLNFIAAVRSLRREGIPRPVFLILRRILGLLPLPAGPMQPLVGRDAFVAWDRRWMDGGETMATVKWASELSRELQLELDRPIGTVRLVTFRPHAPARASYWLSGVRGTLAPAIDDVTPTAEVVVYPRRRGGAALTACVLLALCCSATARAAGFEARTFRSAAGDVVPYQLFTPRGYDGSRQHPLVVWLHGGAGRGTDNRKQIAGGNAPGATIWTAPAYGAFVVAPQCPEGQMWTDRMEAVVALIRELQRAYRIDPDRIYVAGQSLGGYGAWALIGTYPKLFAAAVPVCGGGDEKLVRRAKDVAVWAFHGELDRAVPVERSRTLVAALRRAGGRVRYTEYAGADHVVWTKAFAEPELLAWLFAQRRRSAFRSGS